MIHQLKKISIGKFSLSISPSVYIPGEDTLFFEDVLKDEIKKSSDSIFTGLEIGCGSGYLSLVFKSLLPESILLACDINPQAVDDTNLNLKNHKLHYNTSIFQSNLFQNVCAIKESKNDSKLDLVFFNPPYVPGDITNMKGEELEDALLGGKETGDQIILNYLNFLCKNKNYLSYDGKMLILLSSWNLRAKKLIETEKEFKIIKKVKKMIKNESLVIYVLALV